MLPEVACLVDSKDLKSYLTDSCRRWCFTFENTRFATIFKIEFF
jgi:hypothetical protein